MFNAQNGSPCDISGSTIHLEFTKLWQINRDNVRNVEGVWIIFGLTVDYLLLQLQSNSVKISDWFSFFRFLELIFRTPIAAKLGAVTLRDNAL